MEVAIWIYCSFTALGVIYAIVHNSTRSKKKDDELKTELKIEVKGIKDQLDDPENGLSAIKKSVDDQRLHCTEVSTRLEEQVKTNTSEIAILRKRKR